MFWVGSIDSTSLLASVLYSLATWTFGLSSPNFLVRISDADLTFTSGTILQEMTSDSVLACGLECKILINCTAFNVRRDMNDDITCQLLSDTPLSTSQDLTPLSGAEYFEETCQSILHPSVATEYEQQDVLIPNSVFIGFNSGQYIYVVNISDTHDVIGMTYHESQVNQPVGSLYGMAKLRLDNDIGIVVLLTDGGLACFIKAGTSSQPCFLEMTVPLTSIFGTDDVTAFLPTKSQTGLMAFGYSQITVMDISLFGDWTINSTIDLSPGNQPPGWTNIPRGIVGAAGLYGKVCRVRTSTLRHF